ncbi:MAG: phosphoglycerate kinase [Myxococcota bacterium]
MPVAHLDDLLAQNVSGRRVLVRADLNVPLREGAVSDDTRIRASIPTLRKLRDAGARVIVCSHLGRPAGEPRPEYSLRPVHAELKRLLGGEVAFCTDCVGEPARAAVNKLADGDVLLLENLRFHPGESANEPSFARALAELAEIYVNDAFGAAHRAHASTTGVPALIEERAAGSLMEAETNFLERVRVPERPLVVILGGAKVSDKLAVLEALAPHADQLLIGGAMAYTFMAADSLPTGASLVESERIGDARGVVRAAQSRGREVLRPTDHVVTTSLEADAEHRVVNQIPDGWMAVDIGPETAERYAGAVARARTCFWNGPMGIFEMPAFAKGTLRLAQAMAESPGTTVVGGGDSLAAINQAGVGERISHLSTGGGASLEYVQGTNLPGLLALER